MMYSVKALTERNGFPGDSDMYSNHFIDLYPSWHSLVLMIINDMDLSLVIVLNFSDLLLAK